MLNLYSYLPETLTLDPVDQGVVPQPWQRRGDDPGETTPVDFFEFEREQDHQHFHLNQAAGQRDQQGGRVHRAIGQACQRIQACYSGLPQMHLGTDVLYHVVWLDDDAVGT